MKIFNISLSFCFFPRIIYITCLKNVIHSQWRVTAWGITQNNLKRNVLWLVEEENTSTLTCPQQAIHTFNSFKPKTE